MQGRIDVGHLYRQDRIAAVIVSLMLIWGAGCTSNGPTRLRLHSQGSDRLYSQQFTQAYFSETNAGEYEVVLISDGVEGPPRDDKPLEATQTAPLRQVVAIRIHWRPPHGTRADHPSATNSVVDWYVIADSTDQTRDRLHYQGAAFVRIYPKEKVAHVVVRSGSLTPLEISGSLSDPVGESSISGSFVAKRNDTMVAAVTTPIRMESLARVRTAGAKQAPPRSAGGQ